MSDRCSFAVALFHAFGHRIQCQVVYNPRYRTGFGLTNGEGNERVWSLSRDLIASERVMGVSDEQLCITFSTNLCRQSNRRMLTLAQKMERIARLKRASYKKYMNDMVKRIQRSFERAKACIDSIPKVDGFTWDKRRLIEEWEIKKSHHLSSKECKSMDSWLIPMHNLMAISRY